MIQGYILTIFYLVFSSLLLFVDFNRQKLAFMLRYRALLEENKRYLDIYFFGGLLIGLLVLFVPISPGPIILGDLIPSLLIFLDASYFRFLYSEHNKDRARIYYESRGKVRKNLGYINLIVVFLHFLFPAFVLL